MRCLGCICVRLLFIYVSRAAIKFNDCRSFVRRLELGVRACGRTCHHPPNETAVSTQRRRKQSRVHCHGRFIFCLCSVLVVYILSKSTYQPPVRTCRAHRSSSHSSRTRALWRRRDRVYAVNVCVCMCYYSLGHARALS